MTLSVASWRARRLPRTTAGRGPGEAVVQPDPIGASARRQRRHARADRAGSAAAANDRFLDFVVLLSAVVFVVLAAGVGALVLQAALRH